MRLLFQIIEFVALVLWLALVLMPFAAVVAHRREETGRPFRYVRTATVSNVAWLTIVASPFLASIFTPDWSPVTMLLLAGAGWASAAWSGVFLFRSKKGVGTRVAIAQATLAAFGAPLLGACWIVSGIVGGALFG